MTGKIRALIVALTVTTVFLLWVGLTSGWQEIWLHLKDVNWLWVASAALIALPVQWLRAKRFKILLKLADKPDWPMFRVAGLLVFFNTLIPFRLGELSFPILVSDAFGISKAYALGVLTFVRCFDLALVFLLLAVFGSLVIDQSELATIALIIGLLAFSALLILLFFASPVSLWLRRFTGASAVGVVVNRIIAGAAALKGQQRLVFCAYSVLIWLLLGAMASLGAMAVIPTLPVLQGLFAAAAANIGFALPLSGVASLGPAQVAWAEALRLTGHAYTLAIASSLAVHATVLMGIGLTVLVVLLKPNHNRQ